MDRSFPLYEEERTILPGPPQQDGAIVRHIASFLTLSDAASMGASSHNLAHAASWSSFLTTPDTPGLMALSPDENGNTDDDFSCSFDEELMNRRLQDRQRRYVTQKLATAVFSHPQSLRQFCVKAHKAATDIHKAREQPETFREPQQPNILQFALKSLLQNVPLSVLIHLLDVVRETVLDTTFSGVTLTVDSINGFIEAVVHLLNRVWSMLTNLHFSSASDVFASGIQSVATGIPSARNRDHYMADTTFLGDVAANRELIEKLSQINSAAQVISYRECEDEALTKHAKKRVQRMMHYDVSLRPFFATVVLPVEKYNTKSTFGNVDFPTVQGSPLITPDSSPPSPFMCTPKSFPPTPASRSLVMARGTKFAEDVIFLARDKLRVEDGLDSENDRTRAMAYALRDASRLAVFNAADIGGGIVLTCGQHVATKGASISVEPLYTVRVFKPIYANVVSSPPSVGSVMYCSTRSMVPVLRNCFAYFEMTVLPRANVSLPTSMLTLSIGLSTLEMPLNTLVGAWKGSVGLCTTGQILTAGQWCSPLDPNQSSYGDTATVGCLVHLDDQSAFETWDGVMVAATVTFNVNGQLVSPPVQTMPEHESQKRRGPVPHQSTLPLLVPMEEELFPTLTLHSPGTQVMCRFSSEDLRATWREHIGAPPGVPVYSIDGSVLFQSNEGNRPAETMNNAVDHE